MSSEGSVTAWIRDIQEGKHGLPEQALFERFFDRLTALARKRLRNLHAHEDGEDAALSAMKFLFRRAPEGGFPELSDRDSLWSLLATITLRKAANIQRRHLAAKRDARRTVSLDAMLRIEPSEELLESVFEEGNRLLDCLENDSLRQVACLRMEGYSNQEIAEKMSVSLSTVKRKFGIVRRYLESQLDEIPEP